MKVLRKLDEWRNAGLIDDAHVASITRYEEQQSHGAQWGVWGIGAVGALAVTTGIISVISANWDVVPAWAKLLAALSLMLGALAGAWRTARLPSPWPRDLFLFFHDGMVLATIGLVAQIYHLHGHAWRAPALCALLALPAAAISRRGLLTYVVLAHVTVASCLLLEEVGWIEGQGLALRLVTAGFGLALLAGARLLAGPREETAAALRSWGFALLFCVVAHACAVWSGFSEYSSHSEPRMALYAATALFLAGIAVQVGLELATPAGGRSKRLLSLGFFVVLFLGAVIISATRDSSHGSENLGRQLVGFALSCGLCIAVAVAAAHGGSQRGTNLATLALATRILFFYVELAKDLMTTGAGLIVTGAVFLGLAYGWWRLRRVLPVNAEGGAS